MKEEAGYCRKLREEKAGKQRGKQTKKLQVDNYVIQTCTEQQEVVTKKVK